MLVVSELLGDLLRGVLNVLVIPEKDLYWNEIEKTNLKTGVRFVDENELCEREGYGIV